MVRVKIGDLFDSQAQTLVNTVNCVGVMGKGVALEFKERFPEMYEDYVHRCDTGLVSLGRPYLYKRTVLPWILNFPTKEHWRSVSRLQDIIEGLQYLEAHYQEWGVESLAVPPLGCGQGQLEWRVVGPTLYRHLKRLDIPVELYAAFGTPHGELEQAFLDRSSDLMGKVSDSRWNCRIEPGWIAIVEILKRIEQQPYHRPVGRISFQKIAYFATESGIQTGLQFKRGSFGPHAAELKQKMTVLVNNGLVQEKRIGQMFAVRVGLTFSDASEAYAATLAKWETAIERVTDLFLRMTTQQAEVAATVHFAARELQEKTGEMPTEEEVVQAVAEWKVKRRPPLDSKEVAVTTRHLNMLGWIQAQVSKNLPVIEPELISA